jgi:hypothetical protein
MLSAAGTIGPLTGSGVAILLADALPALSHAAARFSTATAFHALGHSATPLAVSQVRSALVPDLLIDEMPAWLLPPTGLKPVVQLTLGATPIHVALGSFSRPHSPSMTVCRLVQW